jgi:1,4-dihydroxy-2-naphthoyl-CoA synthase
VVGFIGELFAAHCTTQNEEEKEKAFLEKREPEWKEK